jgi:exopolysaccharide biosynthesis polyprenyl glycosylphosphotransferase
MSTHVELRLPRVDVGGVVGDATADLVFTGTTPESTVHGWRATVFGLRSSSVESGVRLGMDLVALALTIAIVHADLTTHVLWAAVVLASLVAVGLYRRRLRLSALDEVPAILFASTVGLVATSVVLDHLRQGLRAALLGGLLLIVGRVVGYAVLRSWRSHGLLHVNAVLIGGGSRAADLVTRISQHPETGLRLRGVLGDHRHRLPGASISGDVADLPRLIASGEVDAVIVGDASSEEEPRVLEALRHCAAGRTEFFVLPRLPEFSTLPVEQVWGVPLERLRQRRSRERMAIKRLADVTIASAALLFVCPFLAIAALAVRLELGPGVIYRQERVGLNGRLFQLLKLRSMRPEPVGTSSEWAANTDRTGRVGAFIRRYSIDELPQLVNVLRGDMSLVGPRPERPEYVDKFGHEFPSYMYRHRVMVGLTGLAAVEGLRGDTSIADRAYFDNWYIEHWSLWLDVKIMVRTASALLNGTGH